MSPNDTIQQRAMEWLTAHPGWWSRLEISIGVGCKKSSHLVRVLNALYDGRWIDRSTCMEHGRIVTIYAAPQPDDLPF